MADNVQPAQEEDELPPGEYEYIDIREIYIEKGEVTWAFVYWLVPYKPSWQPIQNFNEKSQILTLLDADIRYHCETYGYIQDTTRALRQVRARLITKYPELGKVNN